MSGNNPYAVNGYDPYADPYAPTNTTNSAPSGRYADPYAVPNNNASTALVNSYGSRDRRRPGEDSYQQRESPVPNASYNRPRTADRAGVQEYERPQRQAYRDDTRQRGYNDSRSRERRGPTAPPQLPPSDTMPMNGGNAVGRPSSNRVYSPRRPTKPMEEILKHIQANWKNMEGDECVPVRVALHLMDTSTLGLADKEGDFADTHVDLQKCLKGVVNEHYADFNSAVGTYHKIQNAIRESQHKVRMLKVGLTNVKGGMTTVRPELKGLAEKSGELDGLLSVLGLIEGLKSVPLKLEERITEKRFLGAVDILNNALRNVKRSEMDGLGATGDLRSYLLTQEATLTDILIEELHDHLYLKSPYCQDRWKGKKNDGEEKDAKASMTSTGVNAWDRPVYHYLSDLDTKSPMAEDTSKNPEADTFYYIHMILESLNRLGHLDEGIERIEQRMPTELFKVIEKTNVEIDARHPGHLRGKLDASKRPFMHMQADDLRSQVLSDFLWTIYSKFEAIAEGHRVLHEVVSGIVEREKPSKPERYKTSFRELWKLYQLEMRSILHGYLAVDGDASSRSGLATTSGIEIFSRQQRDRNKKMFKLSEMDPQSSDMQQGEAELDEILKSSVPGLVSKTRDKTGLTSTSEHDSQDKTAAGHKLLIEPSVFNMTILLPPSLTFLQHLKDIVPSTSGIPMSTLTSFLDDFLINVFHPQLEETVTELSVQCMLNIEAFTEASNWSRHAPHPIFKGAIEFVTLIRAFSSMLASIPHDQMFTQLIISQLSAYYNKCLGFYKALVSRVAPSAPNTSQETLTMKAAAAYAGSGEVSDASAELLGPDLDSSARAGAIDREIQALLKATKASPLSSYDIISDPKTVHQLALIYNSMQWISATLTQLRQVEAVSHKAHSRTQSGLAASHRRWTLISNLKLAGGTGSDGEPRVYLPLTSETAIPYDNVQTSFQNLARTCLVTLHIDIRCGIIHQLNRCLQPSDVPQATRDSSAVEVSIESGSYPFVISSLPTTASPLILDLNKDLISFDSNITTYLGLRERQYISSGLAQLADKYFVVGADDLEVMNTNGAERMRINTMVVQQNLKNIVASTSSSSHTITPVSEGLGISSAPTPTVDEATFALSARYYDLFLQGPQQVIKYVQEQKTNGGLPYTYDEMRTLVELCFSAKLRGEDREEGLRARKLMGELLLQLQETMWD